jgi:hypothetical protein
LLIHGQKKDRENMGNGHINIPDEGISGFKKSDYVSPEKVLGPDVRIEELPDGIRFYLKGQVVNLGEKRIVVNLYEMMREPDGLKLRREHLEKFNNRIPDDEEISLKYGPSEEGYIWIAKWRDIGGAEMGVMSETIRVSEKWRGRFEEHQRKSKGLAADSAQSLPLAHIPAVPQAPALGPMEIINMMNAGEDRAFRNMERMAAIFKGNHQDVPSSVMEKAYESAGAIMQKAMESNLQMGKAVDKVIKRNMEPVEDEGEEVEEMGAPADLTANMPAWLKPFLPQIETWLGTLLGGGPMGAAVKTLIISSDQWKEIFEDQEKFGTAVAAMEQKFGSERTEKAMNILLNRKPKTKGK